MMMKRKRMLTLLTAAGMCLANVPLMPAIMPATVLTASAAETSGTCGENLTWSYTKSTKTLTISGTGNMDDYNKCIWIGSANKHRPWDYVDGDITQVVIEDGVNGIGSYAFYSQSVTEISIPNSVTILSESAFCGCDKLTALKLPGSITEISQNACYECSSLKTVQIGEGAAAIGDYAFWNCEKLEEISLPDSLQSIGGNALSGTAWLKKKEAEDPAVIINGILYRCKAFDESVIQNIVVPDGVTFINEGAFSRVGMIKSVKLPASVTAIDKYAFYNCYGLESVTISEGTTKIGESAFEMCSRLKEITIPESVTEIGEDAIIAADGMKIYGYTGSYAETYANENGIAFEALAEPTTTTTTTTTSTTTTPKPTTTVTTSTAAKPTTTTAKATTTTTKANTTTAKATTTTAPVTTTTLTETTPVVTTTSAPETLRGDVNGDGAVSVDDAQLTLKAYTNRIAGNDMGLTAEQIRLADVDGNGEISVEDAQWLLKYYTEKYVAGKDITWDDIFGRKTQSLQRLIRKSSLSLNKEK